MRTAAQAGISSSNRGVHIFFTCILPPKRDVQILLWTRLIILIYLLEVNDYTVLAKVFQYCKHYSMLALSIIIKY